MSYLGLKPSGYRHPFDPSLWKKQTWVWAAAIVLVALLFAMGLSHREDAPTTPTPAAATKM